MNQQQFFDKLIISFDTVSIPPPFCHKYEITINKGEKYAVSLNLQYYDREELTEEEIFDEGFTLDDDFAWKGTLPDVWGTAIENKLSISNWKKKITQQSHDAVLSIKLFEKGKAELMQPADQRSWEIFAQEIIQTVFELGEKEAPLQIEYASVDQSGNKDQLSIICRFATRQIELKSSKGSLNTLEWKEGQKLMQHIYFFDYLPEDSLENVLNKPGYYLNPGDGYWYLLDESEKDNQNTKDRKEKLVEDLNSYL